MLSLFVFCGVHSLVGALTPTDTVAVCMKTSTMLSDAVMMAPLEKASLRHCMLCSCILCVKTEHK